MILDDHCLDNVLSFVREAPARACCKSWASHIYDALKLDRTIRVMRRLSTAGSISFDYVASRDLGPEITETVAFHYDFFPNGHYKQQYSHSVQEDLADVSVGTSGSWRVEMGEFICETTEVLDVDHPKESHPSSPADVRFNLPVDVALGSGADQHGECLRWERSIKSCILILDFSQDNHMKLHDITAPPDENEDAAYVEVDGRMVQVSEDIRENYPEDLWQNLMSVRVRVGMA
jgi:hypothetical protein